MPVPSNETGRAGFAYSTAPGKLDLDQFRLSYTGGDQDAPHLVCIRLTSDDGRYWAANLYRSAGNITAPPSVPVPTSYNEQLKSYGVDGLLVLATFSEDCP